MTTYTATQKRVDAAIGGSISGMIAVTASYPFDLCKTRLHFALEHGQRMSAMGMLKQIGAEGLERPVLGVRPLGGALAYYRGLDQLLPEAFFKVMFRFLAFNDIQNLYRRFAMGLPATDVTTPLPFYGNIVAGTAAGFVEAALVVQVFERGKTLRADFASPYQVWGDAFRQRGVGGLLRSMYAGFGPCAIRQMGNQAGSFSVFYGLKNAYLKRAASADKRDLNTAERLSFGFIGGCSGATLTMPFDVLKSIQQKAKGNEAAKSMAHIARQIVRDRGVLGLYTGLGPRLLRVGLDRAFGFLAFEMIIEALRKWRGVTIEHNKH